MPSSALARYTPRSLQVRMHRDMLRGAAIQATSTAEDYTENVPVISAGMLDYVDSSQVILRSVEDNDTAAYLLVPDCVTEETHQDQMVITDHPVQSAEIAFISDHAYRMPAALSLTYGWSPSGHSNEQNSPTFLRDIYKQCLAIQQNRTLCTINTGKRQYKNMLIQAISMTTSEATENIVMVRLDCREVLIATATVTTVSLRPQTLLVPEQSLGTNPQGQVQLQNAQTANTTDGSLNTIMGVPL